MVGGRPVIVGFEHVGPARVLVHRLKYEGVTAVAGVFAAHLADRIDGPLSGVTFVPRVRSRRWRYGIDQGVVLARALAIRLDVPLIRTLDAGWWSPPSAGAPAALRSAPRFAAKRSIRPVGEARWILVDDVMTTGATLAAAAGRLEESFRADVRCVVATSASEVTSLSSRR